jgi:hypothetical protein
MLLVGNDVEALHLNLHVRTLYKCVKTVAQQTITGMDIFPASCSLPVKSLVITIKSKFMTFIMKLFVNDLSTICPNLNW